MIKKLLLSATFLTTVLFSGLNYSFSAQTQNTVELETLNQEQVKNIIQVNSENELPKDGTTYTLVYSKQHWKLPDKPEKTSEETTVTSQYTTTVTSQEVTTTSSSTTKVHKKKVWMVLLITASVTSLYNLRNVMAQNETKVTTIPVTTFVPTSDHCLYGYIIIPNTSETTKITTEKGNPEILDKPEFTTEKSTPEVLDKPSIEVPTTVGTSIEPTVTTATTTTSTEPTTTTEATSAEPIFESSEVETTTTAGTSTEPEAETEPTTTTETEPTTYTGS